MKPDFHDMTRREIEDYLVERALVEPSFRKRLLAEPETFLRELGLPVGEGVKVRVFDEEPGTFYLVLPRAVPEAEDLDDETMDQISGGLDASAGAVRFFKGYR